MEDSNCDTWKGREGGRKGEGEGEGEGEGGREREEREGRKRERERKGDQNIIKYK